MTKTKKSASAESVQVRPKYGDYERVTISLLARPGHDIPCDQADCQRDAVMAMRTGVQMYGKHTSAERGPNHVRCELHLNYKDGAS